MDIHVSVAVNIGDPSDGFSVRRKITAFDLPLVLRKPVDLLCANVEQADVLVAICSIGANQQVLPIRRPIVADVELFALMRG